MDKYNNFLEQNFVPVKINGITIGLPFCMYKNQYELITNSLNTFDWETDVEDERVYVDDKRTQETELVNTIVEGMKEPSLILSNLANKKYKDKILEKRILQCLSRCYASFCSAQLLFNFKYYIEYVAILRIVYEQCAYVLAIYDKRNDEKLNTYLQKGGQSCVTFLNTIDKDKEKKYEKFYGVLSECSHLCIFKENGKIDEKLVDDCFTSNDKMVVIRSTQKTINNYSIFKKVYDIFVDTCIKVEPLFEKEKVVTNYMDIIEEFYIKKASIGIEEMKKYSDALGLLRGFRAVTKYVHDHGSLDFQAFLDEYK